MTRLGYRDPGTVARYIANWASRAGTLPRVDECKVDAPCCGSLPNAPLPAHSQSTSSTQNGLRGEVQVYRAQGDVVLVFLVS